MHRRILRSLLTTTLLGLACTPADPPPAAEQTPPSEVTPPDRVVTQGPVTLVPVDAPEGSELRWVRANACEDGAPMSLTASDGTGLRLASLTARAVVEGPLAFTELRLSFDNPEDRQLEGRFSITLPPGAAISRFAMQIDGRWQEGEVVERQAARQAYEDFLHRRQDPALLENDAGNVFRARVFPIAPKARKELILSYSQELAHSAEPYRLPLCGLPQLDVLDVDVAIVQGDAPIESSLPGQGTAIYHLDLRREGLAPTKDLEARVGRASAPGLRNGDLVVTRVVPELATAAQPITALTILVDTSASRALDFSGQVDRLGALISALPAEARIDLWAYDQAAVPIYAGPAGAMPADTLDRLRSRGAMGASDLGQALAALASAGKVSPRLLLVGDGVVTAGDDELSELQSRLRALAGKGLTRVDAIIDGGIQDGEMLAGLTRASLDHDGVVLDARLEAATLAERLGKATASGIEVRVPGAEWVWPATLDGIQPGDERLVYVQLPQGQPLEIQLEGAQIETARPELAVVPEPLLARAHAQARIADLQAQRDALAADDRTRRDALKDRIVELSTRHRVLSDFTALLVLETEADYARFGIDRRALADILTVGPAGIVPLRRSETFMPEPEPEPDVFLKATDDKDKGGAKRDEPMAFDDGEGGAPAEDGDFEAPGDMAEADDDEAGPMGGRGGEGERTIDAALVEPEAPSPSPSTPPPAMPEPEAELDGRPARAPSRRRIARSEERREARPPTSGGIVGTLHRETPPKTDPWEGRFATVMEAIGRGDLATAERETATWRDDTPGDVLALVATGELHEVRGETAQAARAYGSLIDLFPSRADIRRMAGERLERLGAEGLPLAIDTYAHAVEQRPDHPPSHRLYAYALLKAGRHAEAFAAIEASLARSYPGGRFAGVREVLLEDMGLVGAAWLAVDPSQRTRVEAALSAVGGHLPTGASTRFVLNWETDANDVDLHVYDAKGNHAFFSNRTMASGGRLYADVTTGYGPECFAIEGKRPAGPYQVLAHYYRRGPMGYGMGKLQVIEHDGSGGLRFSEHPFVIMKDDAYVDLATVGAVIGGCSGTGETVPAGPATKAPPTGRGMTRLE